MKAASWLWLGLTAAGIPSLSAQNPMPSTGVGVLQRMHDAYAGKWFSTLIFWQNTTMYRAAGVTQQVWYESLRYTPATGAELRIDMGDPSVGNGQLATADSGWSMTAGKLVRATANGNPFLPIIEGVYVQPVELTARQVMGIGIDTGKVTTGTWQDKPVWIVGTATPGDTTSSQVWIDPVRLVAVRMVVVLAPGRPPLDIHLDNYEAAAGGWLATKVSMFINGQPRQVEEYHDWKADIPLDSKLFDPATWSTAKHWKQ